MFGSPHQLAEFPAGSPAPGGSADITNTRLDALRQGSKTKRGNATETPTVLEIQPPMHTKPQEMQHFAQVFCISFSEQLLPTHSEEGGGSVMDKETFDNFTLDSERSKLVYKLVDIAMFLAANPSYALTNAELERLSADEYEAWRKGKAGRPPVHDYCHKDGSLYVSVFYEKVRSAQTNRITDHRLWFGVRCIDFSFSRGVQNLIDSNRARLQRNNRYRPQTSDERPMEGATQHQLAGYGWFCATDFIEWRAICDTIDKRNCLVADLHPGALMADRNGLGEMRDPELGGASFEKLFTADRILQLAAAEARAAQRDPKQYVQPNAGAHGVSLRFPVSADVWSVPSMLVHPRMFRRVPVPTLPQLLSHMYPYDPGQVTMALVGAVMPAQDRMQETEEHWLFLKEMKINERERERIRQRFGAEPAAWDTEKQCSYCDAMREFKRDALTRLLANFRNSSKESNTEAMHCHMRFYDQYLERSPRKNFYVPCHKVAPRLTLFSNMLIRMMTDIDFIMHQYTNHLVFMLIRAVRTDAYRFAQDLHLHFVLTGSAQVGKSFLFERLAAFSVDGTVRSEQYQTRMAYQTKTNHSDSIKCFGEMPLGELCKDDHGKPMMPDPLLKDRLSSSSMVVTFFKSHEGNGGGGGGGASGRPQQQHTRETDSVFRYVMEARCLATNDGFDHLPAEMRSRYVPIYVSAGQRADGNESDVKNQKVYQRDTEQERIVKDAWKVEHFLTMLVQKAISAKIFDAIDKSRAEEILSDLDEVLAANKMRRLDSRLRQQILCVAQHYTIAYSIYVVFFSEMASIYGLDKKHFELSDLLLVEPYIACISEECIYFCITLFRTQIFDESYTTLLSSITAQVEPALAQRLAMGPFVDRNGVRLSEVAEIQFPLGAKGKPDYMYIEVGMRRDELQAKLSNTATGISANDVGPMLTRALTSANGQTKLYARDPNTGEILRHKDPVSAQPLRMLRSSTVMDPRTNRGESVLCIATDLFLAPEERYSTAGNVGLLRQALKHTFYKHTRKRSMVLAVQVSDGGSGGLYPSLLERLDIEPTDRERVIVNTRCISALERACYMTPDRESTTYQRSEISRAHAIACTDDVEAAYFQQQWCLRGLPNSSFGFIMNPGSKYLTSGNALINGVRGCYWVADHASPAVVESMVEQFRAANHEFYSRAHVINRYPDDAKESKALIAKLNRRVSDAVKTYAKRTATAPPGGRSAAAAAAAAASAAPSVGLIDQLRQDKSLDGVNMIETSKIYHREGQDQLRDQVCTNVLRAASGERVRPRTRAAKRDVHAPVLEIQRKPTGSSSSALHGHADSRPTSDDTDGVVSAEDDAAAAEEENPEVPPKPCFDAAQFLLSSAPSSKRPPLAGAASAAASKRPRTVPTPAPK